MSIDLRSKAVGLSAVLWFACTTVDPPPLDDEERAVQQAPHIDPRRSGDAGCPSITSRPSTDATTSKRAEVALRTTSR